MAAQKLFGNSIAPSCNYCTHHGESVQGIHCQLHFNLEKQLRENGECALFTYDPLLRKPKSAPTTTQFRMEDFML